jgi:hypothetical protein
MILRLLLFLVALALATPALAQQTVTSPTNLQATSTTSYSIDLTWTGSTSTGGPVTYPIERGDAFCQNFNGVGQPSITSFTDVGLLPSTQYCYRVHAFDGTNFSQNYTNTAVATTIAPRTINLAWNDNSPNGQNPTPETGFQIERCPGAACSNFSILTSVGPNVTTFTDTTSPAPIAGYRVTALPLGSGYSNIIYSTPPTPPYVLTVTPASLSFSASVNVNPPTQGLAIGNGGGTGMTWTAASNASWLSVAPQSGIDNTNLVVTVNVAGLASGSYSGAITVTAPGASGSPAVIVVSLSLFPVTTPGGGSSGRVR